MLCKYFRLPKNCTEFFYRLIRASLYAFTFILCIFGVCLVFFSFWYIYEGQNYHLDNSIKFSVFTASFVIGFVLFCLSACGLLGVLNEKTLLAKIFLIGIVLLMIIELNLVFLIYSYKKEIMNHANSIFRKFLLEYADDDDVRTLVDTIQSDLKCCGISSPNDWEINPYYNCSSISTLACSVPASCCYNYSPEHDKFNMFCGVGIRRNETVNQMYRTIHITGCKYSIYAFLDYKHKLTSSILSGILVPQLVGVLLIASYILTLRFLIQYESVDADQCECEEESYVVKFERSKDDIPVHNLFSLSMSGKNEFLNKETYSYINRVFENDQSSICPDSVAFTAIDNSKIRY
ncbi:tetraspanin-15 [Brachionus plicatilis]|uniref:Tetraspanin-15 n=1 Tax=Brachionus plicatilis TaxID=10195 RepID=A0A3M7RTY5_BRAPC|nr:tetraspanin-15 [Brachionus plicatilis]